MNDEVAMQERLSALADGELSAGECADVLAYARTGPGQSAWKTYHVVGDVLRGVAVSPTLDAALLDRLRVQMAKEPRLAPVAATVAPVASTRTDAANAPLWHWKLAAGFASLTAAVALGWTAYANLGVGVGGAGAQLAAADPVPTAPAQGAQAAPQLVVDNQNVIRDPRLDELMRQSSRYSGMSVVLREPFLRNASLQAAPKR